MKLHELPGASSPERVRLYLEEKGLGIPSVTVDLPSGDQRSPEFLAKNPMGRVPVLELEDGCCLSETLAIMQYLEELYPDLCLQPPTGVSGCRIRERVRPLPVLVLWGVPRSGRFSAVLGSKRPLCAPRGDGVALTLTLSLGFAVTIAGRSLLDTLRFLVPPPFLLLALGAGPLFGLWLRQPLRVPPAPTGPGTASPHPFR